MSKSNRISFLSVAIASVAASLVVALPIWAQQSATQKKARPQVWQVHSRTKKKSAPAAKKAPTSTIPELVIAGRTVLRLNARAGGMTPQERGYELSQRIGPILTMPNLTGGDVQVHQLHTGGVASIYVRDQILVTVDGNLAAANHVSIDTLAQQWAQNLRETLPKVNVAVRMSDGMSHSSSSSMPSTGVPPWDNPASTVIPGSPRR